MNVHPILSSNEECFPPEDSLNLEHQMKDILAATAQTRWKNPIVHGISPRVPIFKWRIASDAMKHLDRRPEERSNLLDNSRDWINTPLHVTYGGNSRNLVVF